VKAAKRTADYRGYHQRLRGVLPADVWLDEDQGASFVLFSLAPTGAGHEAMLGFAIDTTTLAVLRAAPISVHLTQDAWVAQNIGPGR
jgi:hypothetical protein